MQGHLVAAAESLGGDRPGQGEVLLEDVRAVDEHVRPAGGEALVLDHVVGVPAGADVLGAGANLDGAVAVDHDLGLGGWWAASTQLRGGPSSASEERNAPEAIEVRKLMEGHRYQECIKQARKAPANRYVISTWLSCAMAIPDYEEAGRACAAC